MANDTVCHRVDDAIGNNMVVQLIVGKIAKSKDDELSARFRGWYE